MITFLLIANRGEIAWPFIRTAPFPGTGWYLLAPGKEEARFGVFWM